MYGANRIYRAQKGCYHRSQKFAVHNGVMVTDLDRGTGPMPAVPAAPAPAARAAAVPSAQPDWVKYDRKVRGHSRGARSVERGY